jgi:ATP-dependent DNA helicase RecQ
MVAIIGTGERFGSAHLIEVLRGSGSEKVARFGHDSIKAFGSGRALSVDAWRSILRQMIAAGFLELDVGGYGGIHITQQGRALMRDEGAFRYRPDTVAGKPKRAKGTAAAADWSDEEAALLGRLKELRRSLAVERRVPAYVIFADKSLEDMVRRRPRTRGEFAEVSGVGTAKLRDFADFFLAVLMDDASASE